MKYYLIPGTNYDRVGFAQDDVFPSGKTELSRDEAIAAYRNALEWEVGSGYIQEDFDIEDELKAAFGEIKKIYAPVAANFASYREVYIRQNGDGGMSVLAQDFPNATMRREADDTPENRKIALEAGGFHDADMKWHEPQQNRCHQS